jgi:hypothetical protein
MQSEKRIYVQNHRILNSEFLQPTIDLFANTVVNEMRHNNPQNDTYVLDIATTTDKKTGNEFGVIIEFNDALSAVSLSGITPVEYTELFLDRLSSITGCTYNKGWRR